MSRVIEIMTSGMARFPRVSGDEPRHDLRGHTVGRFSPRERG